MPRKRGGSSWSAHGSPSGAAECTRLCRKLQHDSASVWRIVRAYPSTALWPLLVLGVVLGLGIWGLTRVMAVEEASSKDRARNLATDTAVWYQQQLTVSIAPVLLMAAMVQHSPRYQEVSSLFAALAPTLLRQVPSNYTKQIEYVPFGWVRDIYPLVGNNGAAQGFDLFNTTDRDGAVKTIEDRSLTLVGPLTFFEGGYGVIVRQPIFVTTDNATDTFGIPDPLNPACGAACDYDPATKEKFWGFSATLVDLGAIASAADSRPHWLEGQGYNYEVVALTGAMPGMDVVASSLEKPRDPVEALINLPNSEWVVRLAPRRGWTSSYLAGVLAGLVALGVLLAALLFVALLSRQRHKMLLEALLPKDLIKDLHTNGNVEQYGGPRIMQAETTADMMLGICGLVLEGRSHEADLRDVVLVRQAIIRSADIYQPIALTQHIRNANLDRDVARALMMQLGQGGLHRDTTCLTDDTAEGDAGSPPCTTPLALTAGRSYFSRGGGGGDGAHASRSRPMGLSPMRAGTHNPGSPPLTTDNDDDEGSQAFPAVLAMILTPQPDAWKLSGNYVMDSSVLDAVLDAALPTVDTETSGGLPSARSSRPSPTLVRGFTLLHAAAAAPANSGGRAHGGGGGTTGRSRGSQAGGSGSRPLQPPPARSPSPTPATVAVMAGKAVAPASSDWLEREDGQRSGARDIVLLSSDAVDVDRSLIGSGLASGGVAAAAAVAALTATAPTPSSAAGLASVVVLPLSSPEPILKPGGCGDGAGRPTAAAAMAPPLLHSHLLPPPHQHQHQHQQQRYTPLLIPRRTDPKQLPQPLPTATALAAGCSPLRRDAPAPARRCASGRTATATATGEPSGNTIDLNLVSPKANVPSEPLHHLPSNASAPQDLAPSATPGGLTSPERPSSPLLPLPPPLPPPAPGLSSSHVHNSPRPSPQKLPPRYCSEPMPPSRPATAAASAAPESPSASHTAPLPPPPPTQQDARDASAGGTPPRHRLRIGATLPGFMSHASCLSGGLVDASAIQQGPGLGPVAVAVAGSGAVSDGNRCSPGTARTQGQGPGVDGNGGRGPGGRLLAAGIAYAKGVADRSLGKKAAGRTRRSSLPQGASLVEAITSNLQSLPPPPPVIEEVERVLAGADAWQFDTWRLRDITGGFPLSALGFFLIHRAGLTQRFNIKPGTLARLLRHIEAGYPDNPYHSATHAADVLQTLHVLIHGGQLHVHYLDPLGLLAAYWAAIVHDYGHPGLTNDFLIATSDPLAVRYNDRSPLENHHAAASFSAMRRQGMDLLASFPPDQRAAFRKQVIEMVLATDMKQHFALLSHFNTVHRLAGFAQGGQAASGGGGGGGAANSHPAPDGNTRRHSSLSRSHTDPRRDGHVAVCNANDPQLQASAPKPIDDSERGLTLQIALKVADLGHLGEELDVHKRWLAALEEEFFRQGDRERELGLPISPLFDRAKQGASKSQVGFFDFVVLPLVHALRSAFPGAQPIMNGFLANYNYWRSMEAPPPVERSGASHTKPAPPQAASRGREGPPPAPPSGHTATAPPAATRQHSGSSPPQQQAATGQQVAGESRRMP